MVSCERGRFARDDPEAAQARASAHPPAHGPNGKIHYRVIDVVTTNGVPAMIARYQKTKPLLLEALHKHVHDLANAGKKLRHP